MSEGYECANCGGLSGQYGHFSIERDAFTCKPRVYRGSSEDGGLVPCPACGTIGLHFCTGRPYDMTAELEKLLSVIPKPPKDPVPCPDHKRYKAIRPPKTTCKACWRFWVAKHPE